MTDVSSSTLFSASPLYFRFFVFPLSPPSWSRTCVACNVFPELKALLGGCACTFGWCVDEKVFKRLCFLRGIHTHTHPCSKTWYGSRDGVCLWQVRFLGAPRSLRRWGFFVDRALSKRAGEHYIAHYLRTIGHILKVLFPNTHDNTFPHWQTQPKQSCRSCAGTPWLECSCFLGFNVTWITGKCISKSFN